MKPLLASLYGLAVLVGALSSGLVIGTLGVLPHALVPEERRFRRTMPAAQRWARSVLTMLRVRLEVLGEWPLPPDQGAILFCNHRSWLDPVVLMAVTRSNGLSKKQILYLPIIGLYGKLCGAVYFNRRDKADRRRARDTVLRLVQAGHRIQVFPEGTRYTGEGTRSKVYLTLGIDAFQRGIPVVPCALRGTDRVLPPGRPLAWPGQRVRLRILEPLDPAGFSNGRDYARATWDAVCRAYEELA